MIDLKDAPSEKNIQGIYIFDVASELALEVLDVHRLRLDRVQDVQPEVDHVADDGLEAAAGVVEDGSARGQLPRLDLDLPPV